MNRRFGERLLRLFCEDHDGEKIEDSLVVIGRKRRI
jgi:hypothetical protein